MRLDGEPLDEAAVDLPADRLDGAVLQVGRRRFKRLRSARARVVAAPSAVLHCSVALGAVGIPDPSGRHGL